MNQMRQLADSNTRVDQLLYSNPAAAAIATGASNVSSQEDPSRGKKKDAEVLMPEDFAHRPGQAELEFGQLSMQEMVLGTVRIIMSGRIKPSEQTARLNHLAELMIHASSYKWPAVRAFYSVALIEIRRGLRQWSDSLRDLKEEMLKPADVITFTTFTKKPAASSATCYQWNFGKEGCPRGQQCVYQLPTQGPDPSCDSARPCLIEWLGSFQ